MSAKPDTDAVGEEAQASLSLDALARRRALLSGLGKGGAVLAATVPIKSLAGTRVLVCKNGAGVDVPATCSGATSAYHSFGTGGSIDKVYCRGRSASNWCQTADSSWPSACLPSKTFSSCFGVNPPKGGNSSTTIKQCMQNPSTYGVDADWCAAYVNAAWNYTNGYFPYPHGTDVGSLRSVKSWYQETDAVTRNKALSLFKMIQTPGV